MVLCFGQSHRDIGPHILADRLLALRYKKLSRQLAPDLARLSSLGILWCAVMVYCAALLRVHPVYLCGRPDFTSLAVRALLGRPKMMPWLTGAHLR